MSILLDILSQKKLDGSIHASNQEIIGIEIRRKRIELSCTLNGLCFELCSPSYLCKIERNQIVANRYILAEICRRCSITDDQQNMLFHSYDVLLEAIKAYVKEDIGVIDDFVAQGQGFENYRYRILQFMKYIYTGDLYLAKDIYNELAQLLATMQDFDMLVFSIFSVILEYKERNYHEAREILHKLDGITMNSNLSILYSKYLYLTSIMLLKEDAPFYYHDLVKKITEAGYYYLLEDIHYALGIYALKVDSRFIFNYALGFIQNEMHLNSLKYLDAYKRKDMDQIDILKDKPINHFCELLNLILDGKEGNLEMILHLSSVNDDIDFSANLLKYLALKSADEKRGFIHKTMDYYKTIDDHYVSRFFMLELLRMNQEKPHNKETLTTFYNYYLKHEKK